ncbi:MAG TPA: hypothetical protein VI386_19915 [Candidatus Sulfotelmatobacter sp.]
MSHKSWIQAFRAASSNNGNNARASRQLCTAFGADMTFLRSWLVYDSKLISQGEPRKLNWNFLMGMFLVSGASAGFWAGIGVAISKWR